MSLAAQDAPYRVRAQNASTASENRMHDDEVARRYGFRGGLVPGVAVFGYMTRPLVARLGIAWLERGWAEVGFAKPAYEGDLLTVSIAARGESAAQGPFELVCTNEEGAELARMSAGLAGAKREPDARAAVPPAPPSAERPEVSWDLMRVGEPFPAMQWEPGVDENVEWCGQVRDDLSPYREGGAPLLHPGLVLRQANNVLKNRFMIPAWIHTASRITLHRALRAGDPCEVRAIPEEKWERKGHQFVRLYVAILARGIAVAEVLHTAIFRPRS